MKLTLKLIVTCFFTVYVLTNQAQTNSASLYLDGQHSYVSTNAFIEGNSELTIMAWIKIPSGNSKDMIIAGEDKSFQLFLDKGRKPALSVSTNGITVQTLINSNIKFNEWHHITGTFNGATGNMKLYVDGLLVEYSTSVLSISTLKNSSKSNGNFEIGRLSSIGSNKEYFKGEIDEVRVFKTELSSTQIQQMVYQEIENNGNYIKGSIVGKDIIDMASNKKVSSSSLLAYYPMSTSINSIIDASTYNRTTAINNVTTTMAQTAPMPFVTSTDGNWNQKSTWLHGDVWDIYDIASNKEWSIVKIDNNVTTNSSHTNLGLIVAHSTTLTIQNNSLMYNSWYLELNGTIDFTGDSQLIQGIYSDLVSSANGKIIRRQEGTSNEYWYNYWSSPVGAASASALGNDNGSVNNVNNSNFNLGMLKDGSGNAMQFTSANDAAGMISTRWTYKFQNGVTYNDWTKLNSNSTINPGVGYIHKGTGVSNETQQYIFEGKPNNGTIKINVSDTGGAGSVPGVSQTSSLFGNPYASAIDLYKFIDDNAGVISGTIRLWQQWNGNSHNLSDYDGGYAEVNKLGSVRAYQFDGLLGNIVNTVEGTLQATRYLPVGQGFVAEIISNGTIEFNNGQRIFAKENDDYGLSSVFFRTRETSAQESTSDNVLNKIRLEFNSVDGPKAKRELLMGFSTVTTDGYDYGFDSKSSGVNKDDLSLIFNEENMTMQAYSEINAAKEVALNFTASGNHSYTITATEFENLNSDQDVYLRDNLTGDYFDLRGGKEYTFSSEAGEFKKRFTIVFQSEESDLTLDTEEVVTKETVIFYNNDNDRLFVKGLEANVKNVVVVNMLGQMTNNYTNVSSAALNEGLVLSNLNTGIYIVSIRTNENKMIDKKIMIN